MSDMDEARMEAMSDALSEANGEGRDDMKDEVLAVLEHKLMIHAGQPATEKLLRVLMHEVENL